MNQAAISKVERRSDMLISTLRKIIEAMGGELEIRAILPAGVVRINRFQDVRKHEPQATLSAVLTVGSNIWDKPTVNPSIDRLTVATAGADLGPPDGFSGQTRLRAR